MSVFQFLASDKTLKEVENPYLEYISLNEALKRKMDIPEFIVEDTEIDKDEKNIMVCDSEEHLEELVITQDMYYSHEYAKEYSNKQHFFELQWRYTKARAHQLANYLIDQLKNVNEIEVWSIWLDEHESASIRTINIKDLTIADLAFLDMSKGFARPACLIVIN